MKRVSSMVMAAVCVLGSVSVSQAGIINGSFEDLGSGQSFQNGNWGLFSSIPGWSAAPGSSPIEIGLGGVYGVAGYDGQKVLELDSTSNASVSQVLALTSGQYELSFLGARRNGVVPASALFEVYWNHVLVGSYAPSATSMTFYTSTVTAGASNTLTFKGTGTSDSYGALIDDVQLTAVPDAGVTSVLFGMALVGLGCLRRVLK